MLVIIEPGGAELGLETFAEAAFGLGIDVDAFGDVGIHVNSWSVLMFLMFGTVERGLLSATALDVIAAGWPLRWGGRVGIRNYFPHFPNAVWSPVSICAGKIDTEHET